MNIHIFNLISGLFTLSLFFIELYGDKRLIWLIPFGILSILNLLIAFNIIL